MFSKNLTINTSILASIVLFASCKENKNSADNKTSAITNFSSCSNIELNENIDSIKESLKSIITSAEYDDLDEAIDWYFIKKDENIYNSHKLLNKLEEIYRKYLQEIKNLGEEKHLNFIKYKQEIYDNIKFLHNKDTFLNFSNQPSFENLNRHDYSFEKYFAIYETTFIARKFSDTVSSLAKKNNISSDFFPLLEDFHESNKTISFMNKKSYEVKSISISDNEEIKNISKFKQYLAENYTRLKQFRSIDNNYDIHLLNVHGTQGLTAALVIQTLFDLFEKSSIDSKFEFNKNMSEYLKAHTYVNLASLGEQVVSDTIQTAELIKAFTKQKINASKLMTKISNISSVASSVLNVVSVGLSFTELIKAETTADQIQYGTQVFFDSTGLLMGVSNLILYKTGALTASSAIGALAVPFAGLAIGFTGFAEASAKAISQTAEIADRFNHYKKDFHTVGTFTDFRTTFNSHIEIKPINNFAYKDYHFIEDENGHLKQNAKNHDIVIKELNLREKNKVKITYGTHYLYETTRWKEYGGTFYNSPNLHPFDDKPTSSNDKQRVISLNEAYSFDSQKEIPFIENAPIILPMVPESYISYTFDYTPFIISKTGKSEFSALQEIQEKNFKFMLTFFNPHPIEYAIRSMKFDFQPTTVQLLLGDSDYSFFSPIYPQDWKNKIHYNFISGNGSYYLKISNDSNYSINSSQTEKWFIDAQDTEKNISLLENELKIGKTSIKFIDKKFPKELIVLTHDGVYRKFDQNTNTFKLMIIDYNYNNDIKQVIKENINYQIQPSGYIEIDNYDKVKDKKAWFEIDNNKIIAPNPVENGIRKYTRYTRLNQNLVIVGKSTKYYYFYNPVRKELYSMPYEENALIHNNPLDLVDDEINEFYFENNNLYYKTKENIGIAVKENIKHLISIKAAENNPQIIKDIAAEYNLNLSDEILIFNDNDIFTGWYLKNSDSFMSKDLKNEPTFLQKISDFFKNKIG
ncbi:TcdA/TcdB pore-forming domain-containing protein [Pigmentibacter sp. JX0631]|uniref:TcdA/TcdB pore-forming domain-containing protein n=1 Tax=Pigmentibacter sp. JX0631 TaxID=2976982 RepID=UPI0024694FEA|nr:TcdA/TcdB pore-forming domain-containing protein [Pigmentibacter sp. JX0631]WGL58876.1 TcdA/TcdB pore-forming domain-containing protein [Pigmentibacter sp. JX0631]